MPKAKPLILIVDDDESVREAIRGLMRSLGYRVEAVASAQEAERLILNQYKAGTVPYTAVVVAQAAALNNEQAALAVRRDRLVASVALIQALGGGWDASSLPTVETSIQLF